MIGYAKIPSTTLHHHTQKPTSNQSNLKSTPIQPHIKHYNIYITTAFHKSIARYPPGSRAHALSTSSRQAGKFFFSPTTTMSDERTFIAIKPDGVQRGLINKILGRFENRGFKLVGIKLCQPSESLLREHYDDLQSKPFFPSLLSYMLSGPVLATVWEGKDVVKQGRAILGATNPLASAPGTIRGDYAIDMGRNVCHGSDSVESAQKEIGLWFKKEELVEYKPALFSWIYE